ncbi:hypothetical protein [Desulfopila inferna]|nr:hypothetical protein [Desulfopila inferna]MBM9606565.1 hypothetical protein [Desulfopila inferna]
MLPETSLETALITAERIRQKVEQDTDVNISLGVASYEVKMTKHEQ